MLRPFDGFCYTIASEKPTLIDDPSGTYIRPVNEQVTALREKWKLKSHIMWHGDILVAKVATSASRNKFVDVSGKDVPLIYNILARPKVDTPLELEELLKSDAVRRAKTSDATTNTRVGSEDRS